MNMLLEWRDNLLEKQKSGTITTDEKKQLKALQAKIKELNLGT